MVLRLVHGSEPGDSGGPLIGPAGSICAVDTGHGPALPPLINEQNFYPAVDSPDAKAFLRNAKTAFGTGLIPTGPSMGAAGLGGFSLIDRNGNWDGECRAYLESCVDYAESSSIVCDDFDTDGDGVFDLCDDCPTIPNEVQNFTAAAAEDPDGDHIGVACDWCPANAIRNQVLRDQNYEAELGQAFPMQSAPPVVQATDPNRAADVELYLQSFRSDACDPNPIPLGIVEDAASATGALPAGAVTEPSSCTDFAFENCTLTAHNALSITPGMSAELSRLTHGAGVQGAVGARACNAKTLPGTMAGRIMTQHPARVTAVCKDSGGPATPPGCPSRPRPLEVGRCSMSGSRSPLRSTGLHPGPSTGTSAACQEPRPRTTVPASR